MKRWIFAMTMALSSFALAQSPQQLAKKIADDLNHLDTYESFWKRQKVKDPDAYSTLTNFLYRHGKEKIPSAEASGRVIFFFQNDKGKYSVSQFEILRAQPLEISFARRIYRIKSAADAIRLMEVRSKAQKVSVATSVVQTSEQFSLLAWLFGSPVFAAGDAAAQTAAPPAAPVAAPVAVAAMAAVNPIPTKKEAEVEVNVFDVNKGKTGNAIVEALSVTKTPLVCKDFLKGTVTEIPAGDSVFKLSYQEVGTKETGSIEKFTFPDYKKGVHLQYRRDTAQDVKGKPNEELWAVCPEATCSKEQVKTFTKEKLLGEPSIFSMEVSPAKQKALAEFEKYESEYKRVAASFKKTDFDAASKTSVLSYAKSKNYNYGPNSTVEKLASSLTDAPVWKVISPNLQTMLKNSNDTLSKEGTLAPAKTYTDEQLKSNIKCLVYERFQDYARYLKECNADSVTSFQLAVDPKLVNEIIDSAAAKFRPLQIPSEATKVKTDSEFLLRQNSREDLFFLSKEDAAKLEPVMGPGFALQEICAKIETFAKAKITYGDTTAQAGAKGDCLNSTAYEKGLVALKAKIGREAPSANLKDFDNGPLAAANFAGAIAACCKSAPCEKGINSSNLLHAGTFPAKGSENKEVKDTRSKRGQH